MGFGDGEIFFLSIVSRGMIRYVLFKKWRYLKHFLKISFTLTSLKRSLIVGDSALQPNSYEKSKKTFSPFGGSVLRQRAFTFTFGESLTKNNSTDSND